MRDVTENLRDIISDNPFLLTRPMRDVTCFQSDKKVSNQVSTHTPHAGRDLLYNDIRAMNTSFYSHAPCGT